MYTRIVIVTEQASTSHPLHQCRTLSPEYYFNHVLNFPSCRLPGTDYNHLQLIHTHPYKPRSLSNSLQIIALPRRTVSEHSFLRIDYCLWPWTVYPVFWSFSAYPDLDCLLDFASRRLPRPLPVIWFVLCLFFIALCWCWSLSVWLFQ